MFAGWSRCLSLGIQLHRPLPSCGSTKNLDSEGAQRRANFVQYRRPGDHWQMVPSCRKNGNLTQDELQAELSVGNAAYGHER